MQREKTRLGSQPENHAERSRQHPPVRGRGERTALYKAERDIGREYDDPEQGEERARDGVVEILRRAEHRPVALRMQHERERQKCRHLEEEIERDEVGGERRAEHHRLRQEEKDVKPGLALLVGHVAQGVDHREQPAGGGQQAEKAREPVEPQREGERLAHVPDGRDKLRAAADGEEHPKKLRDLHREQQGAARPPAVRTEDAAADGQRGGQEKDQIEHRCRSFPVTCRTAPSPAAETASGRRAAGRPAGSK